MYSVSKHLLFYFKNGQFTGENYLTGKLTVLSTNVLQIVRYVSDVYRSMEEIKIQFKGVPGIEKLITDLTEAGILTEKTSERAEQEKVLEEWEWDLPARYYHARTQYVNFEANNEKVWAELDRKASSEPPPEPYITLPDVTYRPLLPPSEHRNYNIFKSLLERRTCRAFLAAPISGQELSDCMYYSFGKTGEYKGGSLGDVIFKTSPSGGSRHHPEVYAVINRVQDLEPGIYHYHLHTHSLGMLHKGDFSQWATRACSEQKWVTNCSAVFIVTSLLKRNMWKYRHAHAYRVIQLDIGHLAQTFNLTCTAMGLASFGTAALNNALIEEKLKIHPYRQPAMYVTATGHPDKNDPGYAR